MEEARRFRCNPDLILENVEELFREDSLPDLDIVCFDGVVKSYKILLGACSGLVKQCLGTTDLENDCLILPNIATWELNAFHSTLLKFKCAPENEELDAVLKVLTTLGVDIGQYLAVSLGGHHEINLGGHTEVTIEHHHDNPTNVNINDQQENDLVGEDMVKSIDVACGQLEIQCLDLISVADEHEKMDAEVQEKTNDSINVMISAPDLVRVVPVNFEPSCSPEPDQAAGHQPLLEGPPPNVEERLKVDNDKNEVVCPLCGLGGFKTGVSYEKHLASHQNHNIAAGLIVKRELKEIREDLNNQNIQDSEETLAKNLHHLLPCEKCDQNFATAKKLADHAKTHEPREFSCEVCHKSFKLRSTLTNHMKFHDEKERSRRFACDICNGVFTHPSNLRRHIKSVHGDENEERKLGCYVCGKLFKDNGTLKFHIENHNPNRKFACQLCNKSYTRKSQLEAHHRVHTGEKPFECNICGKRFRLNGHLKSHKLSRHVGMKLEKTNLCPECGQGFIKEYDLRIHLRRHRGERPFTCEICNKSFLGERNFRDHSRVHTGERPYECETCQKTFTSASGIRQHFTASLNCRVNASEGAYSKFKQKRTEWLRLEGLSLSELITTEEGAINLNEYTVEQNHVDITEDLNETVEGEETIVYLTEPELALVASQQIVAAAVNDSNNLTAGNQVIIHRAVPADGSTVDGSLLAAAAAGGGQVTIEAAGIQGANNTSVAAGQVSLQAVPLQIEAEGNGVVLTEFLT
eukprot:TRINITY_DN1926_c0_g1_i9.p1 TRINITY_DN1926_c0_g1~~TRINITY_DN1926_c0_g1_i9.p1  ORF type:complete len:749 (-),score=119.75 TRINITY_DN1926_c0_g1_i9:583-2829(-)